MRLSSPLLLSIAFVACRGPVGPPGGDGADGDDGQSGSNALIELVDEAPGENCADGGVAVTSGTDTNDNGVLDEDEVSDVYYVCDGQGSEPPQTVRVDDEEPGENCVNGGVAIHSGADLNRDGLLSDDEIEETSYVCEPDAPAGVLIDVETVTTSDDCPAGGILIHAGTDDDDDGILGLEERDQSTPVCDGSDGSDVLVETSSAQECPAGGVVFRAGIDSDGNGILNDGEATVVSTVCNGQDALQPIVDLVDAGEDCDFGGSTIRTGLDEDGDGALSDEEVQSTTFICDAPPTVVVRVDPLVAGETCPAGGTAVSTGPDADGNGLLDVGEEESTVNVCAGETPPTSLVEQQDVSPGGDCDNGGVVVHSGLDLDDSGTLEDTERTATRFVCNGLNGEDGADGQDGATALVRLDSEAPGDNCLYGGTAIHSGIDADGSGMLESGEEQFTEFVCESLFSGPTPKTFTVRGLTDIEHTASDGEETAYTTVPDMQLEFTLDDDYVVMVQWDINVVGETTSAWVATRINIDGEALPNATHGQPSNTGEDDHLHAFRLVELSAGTHVIKAEWGRGLGTMSSFAGNPVEVWGRQLSVLAVPSAWEPTWGFASGEAEACHDASGADWTPIPDLELTASLAEPAIVFSQMDMNVVGGADHWVSTRLNVSDVPDSSGTHTQPSLSGEDDHMTLFRIDRLDAGDHSIRAEWGYGGGQMCNAIDPSNPVWTRAVGYLAIPESTGIQYGYAAPNTNTSRAAAARWDTMPGLSIDLELTDAPWFATFTTMAFDFTGVSGAWVGARLTQNGLPSMRTHAQPIGSGGEDDILSVHTMNYVPAGYTPIRGEWGQGGGTAIQNAADPYRSRRLGVLSLPVAPR